MHRGCGLPSSSVADGDERGDRLDKLANAMLVDRVVDYPIHLSPRPNNCSIRHAEKRCDVLRRDTAAEEERDTWKPLPDTGGVLEARRLPRGRPGDDERVGKATLDRFDRRVFE